MHKNPKFLYSIIGVLILIIILIGGYISLNDSSLVKNDIQKWSEFKILAKKDAQDFNNRLIKEEGVAKKHYPIIKNIDCNSLDNLTDKNSCQKFKDLTIKRIEKPNEIVKSTKYPGEFNEYQGNLLNGLDL